MMNLMNPKLLFRLTLLLGVSSFSRQSVGAETQIQIGEFTLEARTDANVRSDLEAVREAGLVEDLGGPAQTAKGSTASLTIGKSSDQVPRFDPPATTQPNKSSQASNLELPKYELPELKTEIPPADQDGRTKPSLGANSESARNKRALDSNVQPATYYAPAQEVYREVMVDECGRRIIMDCEDFPVVSTIRTIEPADRKSATTPAATTPAAAPPEKSPNSGRESDSSEPAQRSIRSEKRQLSYATNVTREATLPAQVSKLSGGAITIDHAADYKSESSQNKKPARDKSSNNQRPQETYRTLDEPVATINHFGSSLQIGTAIAQGSLRPIGKFTSLQLDSEASQIPSVSGSSSYDRSVIQAAFQGPGNLSMPSSGGSFQNPNGSSLGSPPNYSSDVTPESTGGGYNNGSALNNLPRGSTVTPLDNNNYSNGNSYNSDPSSSRGPSSSYDSVPTFPRTAPIRTGEPYVTEGPCQFDAYSMVQPAACCNDPCATPHAYVPQPGGYTAAPNYIVPGYTAPPTIFPNQVGSLYSSNNSGFRPLFGFGQENYNVQVGRGIYGQPVAYVPGQRVRNFFRYIFP